jgi:formylglycine-generating enzyme required for sulfatase activity
MVRCGTCDQPLVDGAVACPRCARTTVLVHDPTRPPTVAVPPPAPAAGWRVLYPGARIGGYVLGPRIGEGGMSAVYLATDEALGRRVALKVLQPNLVGDAGMRRRFLREGRVARLLSHPNVVPVFDVVADGELVALVMEHVEAPTLASFAAAWRGPLPIEVAAEIADGVLAGLQAAHEQGVVHRDLKPGNVLIASREGRYVARIIDFGIARVLEGTTYTLSGAVLGTCRYMSPEQVRGQPVDPRADLYAFGVVLFELLAGRPPFLDPHPYALMMAHASQPPPAPSSLRPDLPPALEALVLACLAKDPAARPPSAAAVREALAAAVPRTAPAERRVLAGPPPNGHALREVPAGRFAWGPDRRPVWLDAFGIDRYPVTNRQYHAFLRATAYRPDDPARFLQHWPSIAGGPSAAQADLPVVYVSHADALAYASWLGLRLPTEAEWEKAVRGVDGHRYPWGAAPPTPERAWFASRRGPAPVGERPAGASPFGVEDAVGQVWEWTADEDDPAFVRDGPDTNPRRPVGPRSLRAAVRGGAWMFDDPKALRATARTAFPVGARQDVVGFRCAL